MKTTYKPFTCVICKEICVEEPGWLGFKSSCQKCEEKRWEKKKVNKRNPKAKENGDE